MKWFNIVNDIIFYTFVLGTITTMLFLIFAPNMPIGNWFWISIFPFSLGALLVPIITCVDIIKNTWHNDA